MRISHTLLVLVVALAACSQPASTTVPVQAPTDGFRALAEVAVTEVAAGNTIAGLLDLTGPPVTATVLGEPVRVDGRLTTTGIIWEVRDVNGVVHPFLGDGDGVAPIEGIDAALDRDAPLDATVTPDGDLDVDGGTIAGPFLLDAQPVALGDGLAAVLADPTTAYGHGVIGDSVEAGSVAIVDVAAGDVVRRLQSDPGRVIEQRRVHATVFEDVPALVVTTSSPDDGARVELWTVDGERRLVGPAIGQGNRWRHVIGVSELPGGGIEIAEVITPHLGRTASFLRPEADRLVQVAVAPDAIASHRIGSRNLDQTALVDINGDGRRDLVGPSADNDGIAWVIAGEDTANQTDAGLVMATNIAMVTSEDGTVVMAYATADGTLVLRG